MPMTRNQATSATGSSVSEDSAAMPEVSRVGIRVPPFWPEQPAVWFHQIEAQFVLSGVTVDSTKFYYVMSQLESKYAAEVQDIFDKPPETDKYETLKKELIRRLTASQGERIERLLAKEEMGDRTPSQFLRHMQNLAGTTVSEEFLRTLWSRRLPTMTRAIVNSQPDLPLSKLAEIADQIRENSGAAQVASVQQESVLDQVSRRLNDLALEVAELRRSRVDHQPAKNFRRRSRSRSFKRGNSPAGKKHCWYHRIFGTESTRCRPPCNFTTGNGDKRH
ncbi:uncharacterized protein LOC143266335 [Megachile rotundata]|uniref:uncharacterized protein LOC143265175 n=1 Tax=Megachile rotundata TaxID=143995 RepID=UPI003FD06855